MKRLVLALTLALSVWPPSVWAGFKAAAPQVDVPALPRVAVPGMVLPPAAVVPSLQARLAEPLGEWAKPQASGGKQEASADFERRAFGAPGQDPSGEAPAAPVEPAIEGSGDGRLPPPPGGPQILVHARIADGPARERTLTRLADDYDFKLDHGFAPVLEGKTATFRGLLPEAQVERMGRDPQVLEFGPAAGRVQDAALQAAPPRSPSELAVEHGRALDAARSAEKRRGRALYASLTGMVLVPLALAGGMQAFGSGWIGMPALTHVYHGLVGVLGGLMLNWGAALVRVAKARGRLRKAQAAVSAAAGAQTPEETRQALLASQALAEAVFAVEEIAPRLKPLVAALRRDENKLSKSELGALLSLERLLRPEGARSGQALFAALNSAGRAAVAARRRLLWDDEDSTPSEAAAEDSLLGSIAREYRVRSGAADDAEQDMVLVAHRLDRLYETSGAMHPRHVALALSAATQARWAEYGRGRTNAGRSLMVLEGLIKHQAREREAGVAPQVRQDQARAVLERVISSFTTNSTPPF